MAEQTNEKKRGQRKQTTDEIYKNLLETLEALSDLPNGRGSNIELDEDDERVLQEIYK